MMEHIDERLAIKKHIILLSKEISGLKEEIINRLTVRFAWMLIIQFIATVTTLGFLMDWMLRWTKI